MTTVWYLLKLCQSDRSVRSHPLLNYHAGTLVRALFSNLSSLKYGSLEFVDFFFQEFNPHDLAEQLGHATSGCMGTLPWRWSRSFFRLPD